VLAPSGDFRMRFDAEESPDPENRVTLMRERDASTMPRIHVRHVVSADDRRSIAASLALVQGEVARTGVGTLELPPAEELDAVPLPDGTHQMGLTRMSDSPRSGVVDRECRVHGVDNLYLAGSSVFPVGGCEGPTLTIVALAARLARTLHAALGARTVTTAP
jgi:choline dehydrogenase-like flavoprotein